jgi:hypothetical protein
MFITGKKEAIPKPFHKLRVTGKKDDAVGIGAREHPFNTGEIAVDRGHPFFRVAQEADGIGHMTA